MSHHLTPRTIALGLLTYLLFSTMDSLGRLVMQMGYSQQQVLMCIMSIALLPPLALVAHENDWSQLWPRQRRQLGLMALRVVFSCIELALVFYTFRHLQLAESYALFFTMPIWVALLAALLLHERLQQRQMLAIGLGFLGVIISNLQPGGLSVIGSGHLAGLGAAMLAAIGFIVMRKVSHNGSGTNVVIAMFMGLASFNALTLEQMLPLQRQPCFCCLRPGCVRAWRIAVTCWPSAARQRRWWHHFNIRRFCGRCCLAACCFMSRYNGKCWLGWC